MKIMKLKIHTHFKTKLIRYKEQVKIGMEQAYKGKQN